MTALVMEMQTTPPASMSSELAAILAALQGIGEEPGSLDALSREQLVQTAALTEWALQGLKSVEVECQQKIAELMDRCGCPPSPGLPPPPPPLQACLPWVAGAALPQEQPHTATYAAAAAAALAATGCAPSAALVEVVSAAMEVMAAAAIAERAAAAYSLGYARAHGHLLREPYAWRDQAGQVEVLQPLRDLLHLHHKALHSEDPSCIFVVQQINRLGVRCREVLRHHYTMYGEVSKVVVAHSMVKPSRNPSGQPRAQPGGLGLVVMRNRASVAQILGDGGEQVILGRTIRVERFEGPKIEDVGFISPASSPAAAAASPAVAASSGASDSGNSSPSLGKMEEGSSELCDRSDTVDTGSGSGSGSGCSHASWGAARIFKAAQRGPAGPECGG